MNLQAGFRVLMTTVVAIFLARTLEPGTAEVPDRVAVDVDPYYKNLSGATAWATIQEATRAARVQLEAAAAKDSQDLGGVGDVEWLFADGWQEFTLRAIDGNAEIWVANDLSYCPGDPRPPDVVTQEQIDYLLAEFNNTIYASNTTYFGYTYDREGTSGLFSSWGYDWYETDNPQRVMILVYNIVDESWCDPDSPFFVAGYFWPYMTNVAADRNIIHIDSYDWANRIGPDGASPHDYEITIAHEYEHAIHYDHDPDEPSWVDEGMADLSGLLAGYGHSQSHLAYYMVYHRTPLTVWGGGLEDYGESYLFQLYLMENFGGPTFITALVNEQETGIEGIQNQLAAFGYGASFDDIYRDWTLANYLDEPNLTGNSGASLGYVTLDIPSSDTWGYSIPWSIENYYGSDNKGNLPLARYWGGYKSGTVQWPMGELPPYTPMYLTYKGIQPELQSTFRGNDVAVGLDPNSGSYQLWGGSGNLLFNTATLVPIVLGSNASLSFWTYYEIEPEWDFGFVQISADGGSTWTSLPNAHTTFDHHPDAHENVTNNLPGFTGHSNGWVLETFDLSAYAGPVLLRFLYVTDWATVERGFFIDDVSVTDDTGTVLIDDLELGSANWALNGWIHATSTIAANDWELTFVNPIYHRGKFTGYDIRDDNMFVDGDHQWDLTTLDTSRLTRDVVTIILSNHLPEEVVVPGEYLLLVQKGNARK